MRTTLLRTSFAAWLLAAAAAAQAPSFSITDLGNLGGPGSLAWEVNGPGAVVGASITTVPLQFHAFLYQNGTMTDIDGGPDNSRAYGVNLFGAAVGETLFPYSRATRWQGGTTLFLGALSDSVGASSVAYGINTGGKIVGKSDTNPGNTRAFLWDAGTMVDLGTLGGANSVAYAINSSGMICGAADDANQFQRPFLYSGGSMAPLGVGFGGGAARAINAAGWVTGTVGGQAFFWRNMTTTKLGLLPGDTFSEGLGINRDGTVVGASYTGSTPRAFYWSSATGMLDLSGLIPSGSGWTLSEATGINSAGAITGWGTHNGQSAAFLLQ